VPGAEVAKMSKPNKRAGQVCVCCHGKRLAKCQEHIAGKIPRHRQCTGRSDVMCASSPALLVDVTTVHLRDQNFGRHVLVGAMIAKRECLTTGSAVAQRLPQPGWNSTDSHCAASIDSKERINTEGEVSSYHEDMVSISNTWTSQETTFQLQGYIKHGQNVTTTDSAVNTKFLSFRVTGTDQFVVIEQKIGPSLAHLKDKVPQPNKMGTQTRRPCLNGLPVLNTWV
jgi:hypothetical protein